MKFDVKKLFETSVAFGKEHLPEILTGCSIASWITTTVLASKATPGYLEELEEEDPDDTLEMAKIALKHYKWALLTGIIATGCNIGSLVDSKHKLATALAVVSTYETDFIEYKEKVKEMIGEKKEEKIEHAIAEDHAQNVVIDDKNMIHLGTGTMLCLDMVTGQIFYADRDYIDKRFIDMNEFIQIHEELRLSDYTYILGIENPEAISEILGWPYDPKRHAGEQIELLPTSVLRNGEPIFVIGHKIKPRFMGHA